MDEFPDLPELETVETRDSDMAVFMLVFGGMILLVNVIAIFNYLLYGRYMETLGIVGVALVELLTLWVVLRVLFGYSYYRTDGNGILMKALVRRRFIQWIDVQRASSRSSRTGEPILVLETKWGSVTITPRGFGSRSSSGYDILASAWQHLRRFGRNEGFALPEKAQVFWEKIPDDIPREIDWASPHARSNKIAGPICIAMFVGFAILPWIAFPGFGVRCIVPACVTLVFAAMLSWILPEVTQQARFVRLREEYLEATLPFGKAYIPWSQVVSARWQRGSIVIVSANPRHRIRIVCIVGSRESETLILALIRRLRTAGVPEAIAPPFSVDQEWLKQPAWTGQAIGAKRSAFLNSLDPPARSRMLMLSLLQFVCAVAGLGLGAFVVFTDLSGALSRLLHAGPDARFFIAPSPFASSGLLVAGIFLGNYVGDKLGNLLSGPFRETWRQLQKVGSGSPRSQKAVIAIFILIAVSGLFGFVAAIDSYARFTDKGIAVNGFWEVREEFHPWKTVSAVEPWERMRYGKGGTRLSQTYTIRFDDGSRWKCDTENLLGRQWGELRKAIEFASAKSGKPIALK